MSLDIAGFVYEHRANLPIAMEEVSQQAVRKATVEKHELDIEAAIREEAAGAMENVHV